MIFVPEFEGELVLDHVPDDFAARIERRVDQGLLRPGSRSRANYRVRSSTRDSISFGAHGLLTAYNVGLNEVEVSRSGINTVRYHVTFWRWTLTAVVHGLILGAAFVGAYFFSPRFRAEIALYEYGLVMILALVVFFCLLWPWILTAVHRRPAEHALRRILGEALAPAESELRTATR